MTGDQRDWALWTSSAKKLGTGEIAWSSSAREWLPEKENPRACADCGARENLTTDHILTSEAEPGSRGGDNFR